MDTISPVLIEGMILACTMTPSTQYDFGMHYAQSLSSLNSAWSGLSELDFDDSIHSVELHASKILLLITCTLYIYCTLKVTSKLYLYSCRDSVWGGIYPPELRFIPFLKCWGHRAPPPYPGSVWGTLSPYIGLGGRVLTKYSFFKVTTLSRLLRALLGRWSVM